MPRNEPTDVELICDAVAEAIARPGVVVDNVRAAAGDAVATVGKLAGAGRTARHGPHGEPRRRPGHPAQRADLQPSAGSRSPAPSSRTTARSAPAHGVHGERRRAVGRRGRAAQLAAVPRRARHLVVERAGDGADVGARQADVPSSTTTGSLGNRVSSFLVDLPVGEPSPVVRLHQVAHAMREHTAGSQASAPTRWSGSAASPRPRCTRWAPVRPAASPSGSSTWW